MNTIKIKLKDMVVHYIGGDYDIQLTQNGCNFLITSVSSAPVNGYKLLPLCRKVPETGEYLQIWCTRDSTFLLDRIKADDMIHIDRDEKGLLVKLNPGRIGKLKLGELNYVMRRIHSDEKLWIHLEEPIN